MNAPRHLYLLHVVFVPLLATTTFVICLIYLAHAGPLVALVGGAGHCIIWILVGQQELDRARALTNVSEDAYEQSAIYTALATMALYPLFIWMNWSLARLFTSDLFGVLLAWMIALAIVIYMPKDLFERLSEIARETNVSRGGSRASSFLQSAPWLVIKPYVVPTATTTATIIGVTAVLTFIAFFVHSVYTMNRGPAEADIRESTPALASTAPASPSEHSLATAEPPRAPDPLNTPAEIPQAEPPRPAFPLDPLTNPPAVQRALESATLGDLEPLLERPNGEFISLRDLDRILTGRPPQFPTLSRAAHWMPSDFWNAFLPPHAYNPDVISRVRERYRTHPRIVASFEVNQLVVEPSVTRVAGHFQSAVLPASSRFRALALFHTATPLLEKRLSDPVFGWLFIEGTISGVRHFDAYRQSEHSTVPSERILLAKAPHDEVYIEPMSACFVQQDVHGVFHIVELLPNVQCRDITCLYRSQTISQ